MAKLYLNNQEITPSLENRYFLNKEVVNGKLVNPATFGPLEDISFVGNYGLYFINSYNDDLQTADLSNLSIVFGTGGCGSMFQGCTNLTSVDLSNLEIVSGDSSCSYMFQGCTSLTNINLDKFVLMKERQACYSMFYNCTSLTSIDLHNLLFIRGNGNNGQPCRGMFQYCTSLEEVDLSGLISISNGGCCLDMFTGCTNLSKIRFDSLSILDDPFTYTFSGCSSLISIAFPELIRSNSSFSSSFRYCSSLKHIYFPSLHENSLSSNNCFKTMLSGLTDVTVHLPFNFNPIDPDKIYDITTLSGYPNFGGTNTILVFDQVQPLRHIIDLDNISEVNIDSELQNILAGMLLTSIINNKYSIVLKWSKLNKIKGNYGCQSMFYNCTGLTDIDLRSLQYISGMNSCYQMFCGCTKLTEVNFPSLEYVTGSSACYGMFWNCINLNSISFPALNTNSFGSEYINQFNHLLYQVAGCTIHFPSNLNPQTGCTTISSLTGYPNFGGTNTVLVYDLPATN